MAKLKPSTLRKRIEKDLNTQLKEKWITGNHYSDLIQDYLSLWDLKCKLIHDIETNGTKIPGMYGPKTNPAINDFHKTNIQMLRILSELGLKPVPIEQEAVDVDEF